MSEAEERKNKGVGGDESVPTASFSGSEDGPGGKIGPYKLLSILGEGGFGVVYLAERQRPVRRRVALKVIKPGMDSKQVIARFETERQALALLDHPNIAQVFDAGTTKARRPYFVMEYVKGVPINEHCDREKLSIEERLELFLQVCEGVQHAHQKGIIHRDIKPSNILVTIEGDRLVPKIIDFGVAKAITQPLTERTLYTEQGQLVGTPEYMSPEQAEMTAQDIDTRSDIYSLGVMLYELLTGALPFDRKTLERAGFSEIQRIIREEEPPRPSTKLTSLGEDAEKVAKRRHTEVATLARQLHKELEWIPLMAMRKERTHRYRTAADLADDIQNYLNGVPLTAGPESAVYRIRKFVWRNRAWVAGIAAVLVVLVAGIVASTLFAVGQARARAKAEVARYEAEQAREKEATARAQAEQAREKEASALAEAQAVADFLKNDVLASVEPARAKAPEVTVRYILDAASEDIEGKFEGKPLVEASIRQTLGETYLNLAKYEAAEPHLERARQIRREQLGEEHPETLNSMYNLARLYWEQGRDDEAEPLYIKTLESRRRVLGAEHPDMLTSMYYLAWLYWEQGRFDEAEPLLVKTLESRRRVLGEEHPDTLTSMFGLAYVYQQQGRFDEAEPLLVKAVEGQHRVLGEEHPDTLRSVGALGLLYSSQGRYDKAELLLVKMLEGLRQVLGEEHPDTLESMDDLAQLYQAQGRHDEAESLLVEMVEGLRRVLGEEHPRALGSMNSLAWLYQEQGRYEELEVLYIERLENNRRVLGEEHEDTLGVMNSLGLMYYEQGRYEEAETLYVKLLEVNRRVLGEEHMNTLFSMNNLAALYRDQGRYEEAEPLYVKLLEIARRVLGEEHPGTLTVMNYLAQLYRDQGLDDEAEQLLAKGKSSGPQPPAGAVVNIVSTRELNWIPGKDATAHKVYFGTNSDDLAFLAEVTSPKYENLPALEKDTVYYWRIDAVQADGSVVSGNVWSFTTAGRMLVGWWKFDEGSGTIASDSAGKYNGTVHGAEWTTGQVGGALDFDGTDDYVGLGHIGDFATLTICLWVNIDSLPNIFNSLLHCDGWSSGDVHFMVLNDGCVRFSVNGSYIRDTRSVNEKNLKGIPSAPGDQDSSYAFTSGSFGQWHHIAAIYDSIEKTMDFYIDGQLDVQRFYSSTSAVRLGPARIAGWNSPPDDPFAERCFDGLIDDVRIYNYALSEAEVASIYAGKGRAKLPGKEDKEEQ